MGKYLRHIPKTLALGLPVMVSQLGHIMVGVVDSAMVGRLGTVPLAASALANSTFYIVLAFGIGLTFGLTPLVAAADSEKNLANKSSILANGFVVNTLLGIGIALLVWLGSYYLNFLGQASDVETMAAPYLRIINISGLFFILFQTAKQFAEGLSDTKSAMVISISANLLNVFLNWVLIFGKLGFQPMGLLGAGYATLISRGIMALLMIIYLFKVKRYEPIIKALSWAKLSWDWAKRIMKVGVPSGFQFLFEVGAFAFSAIMIGWLGADALAAHQIALSLAAISYMLASGVAAATTVRIGNQMGLKDYKTLKEIGISSILLCLGIMLLSGLFFVIFRHFLPTLFIEELDVIQVASVLLLFAAAFQLADGVQVVCLGMLRGMEDTIIPTIYTLVSYWLVALPLAYILGIYMQVGVEGVWLGLSGGLILVAILCLFRFNRLTRQFIKSK